MLLSGFVIGTLVHSASLNKSSQSKSLNQQSRSLHLEKGYRKLKPFCNKEDKFILSPRSWDTYYGLWAVDPGVIFKHVKCRTQSGPQAERQPQQQITSCLRAFVRNKHQTCWKEKLSCIRPTAKSKRGASCLVEGTYC